jgi:hypothetical protein
MMTKKEFEAFCRILDWLEIDENRAIYEGSFRKENNDIKVAGDYLNGLISTGSI